MNEQHPGRYEDYIGGLDREQREQLVESISTEFGWLTVSDLSSVTGLIDEGVSELVEEKLAVALEINGELVFPGFTTNENVSSPVVSYAVHELGPDFSDWEKVMWLCSANGILDGKRPIDVSLDEMKTAVEDELSL